MIKASCYEATGTYEHWGSHRQEIASQE
jgi:hypothetical protein